MKDKRWKISMRSAGTHDQFLPVLALVWSETDDH
jgi:hypothetical protein